MDIIKTSDFFFVRKEGVWETALGGLALHVCTSFITNRHNMVRTQTKHKDQCVSCVQT